MERKDIAGFRENEEARSRNDSCGSIEEMEKEKRGTGREGRGEEEIFRRSKKTVSCRMWRKEWEGA